jgi:GntR family transcriptional regulator/MocR family aminotransferase
VRRTYRDRRDRLVSALNRHLPSAQVAGTAAGLHLMLNLPDSLDTARLGDAARRLELDVVPVERYQMSGPTGGPSSLVIGYGNIATSTIDAAVRALRQAIAEARTG